MSAMEPGDHPGGDGHGRLDDVPGDGQVLEPKAPASEAGSRDVQPGSLLRLGRLAGGELDADHLAWAAASSASGGLGVNSVPGQQAISASSPGEKRCSLTTAMSSKPTWATVSK